jgi:5-methylcytosine-specific restriction endonuclease McrBC regulatory subunit McrC
VLGKFAYLALDTIRAGYDGEAIRTEIDEQQLFKVPQTARRRRSNPTIGATQREKHNLFTVCVQGLPKSVSSQVRRPFPWLMI